ncbi:MAG: DUF4271 domain-containing protein [Bacteroidetes bacterium]|nr:DUF4271 domain-containing protein [Bacteroidota bacterium]
MLYSNTASSKVKLPQYAIGVVTDKSAISTAANASVDSMLLKNGFLRTDNIIYAIERPHLMEDKSVDFYLLLVLALILGALRYTTPKYFDNLWRIMRNPGQGRAAKEQLEVSGLANIVMNLFFVVVSGAYLYYVMLAIVPERHHFNEPGYMMAAIIAGMGCIYLVKYLVIKFSGWVFKIDDITEHYIFNIFLINKIIALVLFPVDLFLAFSGPAFAGPVIIVSTCLIAVLFISRYIRSWQVFGTFFQYSKFHFFTYLCASELLPLAVLAKFLVKELL